MIRNGDIVKEIREACDPQQYDFSRAEGRADFDDALRAMLKSIDDEILRRHAAEMIKEWRWQLWERRKTPRPAETIEEDM